MDSESSQSNGLPVLEKKRKLDSDQNNYSDNYEDSHIFKVPKTVGMIKPNEMEDAIQSHQKGHILIKLKQARAEITAQLEHINKQDSQIKILQGGILTLKRAWSMLINDLSIISSQCGLSIQDLSDRLFQSDNSNEFYNLILNEFKSLNADIITQTTSCDSVIPEKILKEIEFSKKLLLAILNKNSSSPISSNFADKLHAAEVKISALSDSLIAAELNLSSTEEELQRTTERCKNAEKVLFKMHVFKAQDDIPESNATSGNVEVSESTSSSNLDVLHEESKIALRAVQNDLKRVSDERLKLQVLIKKLQTDVVSEAQVTSSAWFGTLLKEKNNILNQLSLLESKLSDSNQRLVDSEIKYNERLSILQNSFDASIDNLKSQIEKLLNKYEQLFKENENNLLELEKFKTKSSEHTNTLFNTEYSSIIQSQVFLI